MAEGTREPSFLANAKPRPRLSHLLITPFQDFRHSAPNRKGSLRVLRVAPWNVDIPVVGTTSGIENDVLPSQHREFGVESDAGVECDR